MPNEGGGTTICEGTYFSRFNGEISIVEVVEESKLSGRG